MSRAADEPVESREIDTKTKAPSVRFPCYDERRNPFSGLCYRSDDALADHVIQHPLHLCPVVEWNGSEAVDGERLRVVSQDNVHVRPFHTTEGGLVEHVLEAVHDGLLRLALRLALSAWGRKGADEDPQCAEETAADW